MAYGSIVQRGDNQFRVCFDYGTDSSGKRIRKYQTFASRKEATRALNAHKVKMDEGSFVLPSDYTFAQWLDYWYTNIIRPQIEETTAYGYRNMIENYLKPSLGSVKLQKLSARHIQQYYTFLLDEKGLSPNTVIKHHNLLTNVLNAAERQEYITKNPMIHMAVLIYLPFLYVPIPVHLKTFTCFPYQFEVSACTEICCRPWPWYINFHQCCYLAQA